MKQPNEATQPPQQDEVQLAPLPGEPGIPDVARAPRGKVPRKGLLAVSLLVLTLLSFSALSINRFIDSHRKPDDAASRAASDRPAIASGEPKRPDMTPLPASQDASGAAPLRVPAIVPTAEELADPIGVRRSPAPAAPTPRAATIPAEDAPPVLVSSRAATPSHTARATSDPGAADTTGDALARTRRSLENYQRQLQTLLEASTRTPPAASAPSVAAPFASGPSGGSSLTAATPRTMAATLGNRSLVLPKGTTFTCALKTKVVSATSGLIGCQVQRNVYGDDGRVLLVERGSHLDGDYRIANVRPGTVRIPVVWTRLRTPNGVTVEIDSPGTGQLGESGIDGHVDNRWAERIGAALLLSLIDDSVQLAIQHESHGAQGNAVVLPSTSGTGSKLAEKVLDSTINIPPLIYRNQGGVVAIHVARDVDFSAVYALRPTEGVMP